MSQLPHGSISQQDDARFATFGFNFNNFLPGPPAAGGNGTGVLNTTIAPSSNMGAVMTYNPTGGF